MRLHKLLELLEEWPETEYWMLDVAREAYHKYAASNAFSSSEEIKTLYEKWEPKRKATLAELPEQSGRGVKARVFYFCLDNAYNKHRAEIRFLLAEERAQGKTPASAAVALEQHEKAEAGTADGAGGWVGEVLKYLYEEQERAL